ncbi:MAG: patatin-like phospholipase family protein [Bacillota bacterium]|jgi:NTE family protein
MRRALIFSGGGGKGAFEVGAVDFLVKTAGLDFQIFLGSSVGALNAAMLAMATNYRELLVAVRNLKKLWEAITGNHAIYQSYPLGVLDLFSRNALYNPCGLRRLIKNHIDPQRLCQNPAKLAIITAVAIETGELFNVNSRQPELQNVILDFILASASMPIFFPPVLINGKHWYDGGLRDVTPLAAAFKERPDEIYLVLTFPVNEQLEPVLDEAPYGGVLRSLLRIVSIMTNELRANDLQISKYTLRNHSAFPGRRRLPIHIIAPPEQLDTSPLDFSPANIKENIRLGYAAAQNLRTLALG